MHIPTDLPSWLAGIPWIKLTDEESAPGHSANQPRFTIKPEFDVHELAHLIHCQDEHVLDPLWGLGEIESDFANDLTPEQLPHEMEVITIQEFINYRLKGGIAARPNRNKLFSYISMAYSTWYHQNEQRRMVIDNAVNTAYERWTVESIYAELQRKINLVQTQLR